MIEEIKSATDELNRLIPIRLFAQSPRLCDRLAK